MSTARGIALPRIRLLAALPFALLLGAAPLADAQAPDLVALSVNGAPTAEIGAAASVNVFAVNLGGPLTGEFTLDVVLTADDVVDEADLVVGSTTTTLPGAHAVNVAIPASLEPGTFRWALRIEGVAGEENVFNNSILGGEVELFVIDLCVADASPIAAFAVSGGAKPAPRVLSVANCGSANGLLIFTVTAVPPVPWLTISPTASFALAGNGSQPVTIGFEPGAAAIGAQSTQIVVQNYRNPADFAVIPVTLTLGEVSFTPGDRMVGAVDVPHESDDAVFAGLAGMRLKMKVTRTSGNLAPVLRLLDAEQTELAAIELPATNKTVKKSFKLPATGVYRLRVEGADGSVGGYLIETDRKLPAAAQKQKVTLKAGKAPLEVLALEGAHLDVTVKPKAGEPAIVLSITPPSGQPLDLSQALEQIKNGGVAARGIELPLMGAYLVDVPGLAAGEKVKLIVLPLQPATSDDVVLLP